MSDLIGSIITDCADDHTRSRQELRFKDFFGIAPTFVGVTSDMPDLEAGGVLLDQLEVLTQMPLARNHEAIILLNVAPRGGESQKKWDNGTPFCYFRVDNVLIVGAFGGQCLSLAKKFGVIDHVELMDIPTVTRAAVEWGDLTPAQAERINHTQFRSLEFLPLVAYWLWQKKPVPSVAESLDHLPNPNNLIWSIDNFGNAKTTLTAEDIDFAPGKLVTVPTGGVISCYRRLADVPKGDSALIVGSSGYKNHRFLELVVQWEDGGFKKSSSAASRYGLHVGSEVLYLGEIKNQLLERAFQTA